jgi:hypothetical protein
MDKKLIEAFVAGAKWWEYHSTKFTMWQSDQRLTEFEAIKRYGEASAEEEMTEFEALPEFDASVDPYPGTRASHPTPAQGKKNLDWALGELEAIHKSCLKVEYAEHGGDPRAEVRNAIGHLDNERMLGLRREASALSVLRQAREALAEIENITDALFNSKEATRQSEKIGRIATKNIRAIDKVLGGEK